MAIFSQLLLFASILGAAVSSPVAERSSVLEGFDQYVWPEGRAMPEAITRTPAGVMLAWVRRESQGIIASPPPRREVHLAPRDVWGASELEDRNVERGPEGTVPFALMTKKDAAKLSPKAIPPNLHSNIATAVPHYYGSVYNNTKNYGGRCITSRFKPNVSTTDSESLLQIAVLRINGSLTQSCEAGWQVLGSIHNGDTNPYLFTYYTTDSYQTEGNNIGCYNTNCQGFVQVSDTYHPGMTFTPYSTIGGPQYQLAVHYHYHGGNWWLDVNDVYVGYYPGANYKKNGSIVGTLGEYSSTLDFYGEITDHAYPNAPRTDMGSGKFANTGFGQAGYIRNMTYKATEEGGNMEYTGVVQMQTPQWYTVDPHFKSGTDFGSYMYVGGPGAG